MKDEHTYKYDPMFNGKGAADYCYRPMLDISISSDTQTEVFGALVDSGTDITMVDIELAEILQIDLKNSSKGIASGIGQVKETGYLHTVTLEVIELKEKVITNVLFVPRLGFSIVLGQSDFFNRFLVTFNKPDHEFTLKIAPPKDKGR